MFNFFKRKPPKAGDSTDDLRRCPSDGSNIAPAQIRQENARKDVVNLLMPQTEYNQKTGVSAILDIMGRRKKSKRRNSRGNSFREDINHGSTESCNVPPTIEVKNSGNDDANETESVEALVLQKYPKTPDKQHVSVIYLTPEDEKRKTEDLLKKIARTIDSTVDKINEEKQMGANDSKIINNREKLFDNVEQNEIVNYKNDLKDELNKLLLNTNDIERNIEKEPSPSSVLKKSNLKVPKLELDLSDDDRSDNGKKKVTFQKHIIFDDGEQQTDDEVDSSFESLTSDDEIDENKIVIPVDEQSTKRLTNDNSDSGYLDDGNDVTSVRNVESESECEEEIIEEIIEEYVEDSSAEDDQKTLVTQDSKFQSQVEALSELAESRNEEAERARELIASYRKEIEDKDLEIEQLKSDIAAAYKESELIRQRSRSLEEELSAARRCSADLAEQLQRRNDEAIRQLRAEIEDSNSRRAELESKVMALEREKEILEQERAVQEQKAREALAASDANTAKWRAAHEAARSQAAARAEIMISDCEWKMRELEKKARETDKLNRELSEAVEQLKQAPKPTPSHVAELQQLRGLASEQQRSVQALTLQLQKAETREEALRLDIHRLNELLERESQSGKEKEERHALTIKRLEEEHSKALDTIRAEHASSSAATRAAMERAHAERTRAALAQLRAEAEQEGRNADRKLREVTTRFENLKEVLASKEAQFEHAIAEAHSKADWDILQLRHLLDKSDINYANKIENLTERFEKEKETLIEEWSSKLKELEDEASSAADEAKKLLESTRLKLVAEKLEQVNKLKEKHRLEMDDQWEQFMIDKENCLARMKMECRQEGEEERVKREKELLEEIAELKSHIQSKEVDFDNLAVKAAACGRTLAVTEQELREALDREKELREKRAEDGTKIKQVERASKDQIEHLTRKCACLRKLFDDMRARLSVKERQAEQEAKTKDKELHHLRGEVARLTKILVEQSSPKLGTRTRADGCEMLQASEEFVKTDQTTQPRRKGMC